MKHLFRFPVLISFFLLALSACEELPPNAYENRGVPEKLLTSTSDIVTIDLTGEDYSERLGDALASNPPDRAILNCSPKGTACNQTKQLLRKHNIAVENTDSGMDVVLIYERTLVQSCDNSYTDNSQDQRNLNYDAFGCSIASNTANMVTDKHQFTHPDLLDHMDGEKAATIYDNYLNPPAASSSSSGSGSSGSGSLVSSSSGGQ